MLVSLDQPSWTLQDPGSNHDLLILILPVLFLGKIHATSMSGIPGTIVDSSYGGQPLRFILGSGAVIPGFDQG